MARNCTQPDSSPFLAIVLGIWAFAAVGSLTAASRCTWSFSRDGGIPASGVWRKVNKRFGLPLNALILSAVVDALLGLIYLGSSAAFNAFTGGQSRRCYCFPRQFAHKLTSSLVFISRDDLPWSVLHVSYHVQRVEAKRTGQGCTVLAGSLWIRDREHPPIIP